MQSVMYSCKVTATIRGDRPDTRENHCAYFDLFNAQRIAAGLLYRERKLQRR